MSNTKQMSLLSLLHKALSMICVTDMSQSASVCVWSKVQLVEIFCDYYYIFFKLMCHRVVNVFVFDLTLLNANEKYITIGHNTM